MLFSFLLTTHGEKMLEVRVRFWTDWIASEPDMVIPKHAFTSGAVRVGTNEGHGITPQRAVPFKSLLGLGAAIEQVLIFLRGGGWQWWR